MTQCTECTSELKMDENGICRFQCLNKIDMSLCYNLKEFCSVKLVYQSCCIFCRDYCPDCKDWGNSESGV